MIWIIIRAAWRCRLIVRVVVVHVLSRILRTICKSIVAGGLKG